MAVSRIEPIFEPLDASRSLYDQIGGDDQVRALVERFYDLMDIDLDLAQLRAAHGPSLEQARERLFLFLCGYLGGPNRYVEQFGDPRLRARHLPFSIGAVERDQWLICMGRAMHDVGVVTALSDRLLHSFYGVADWMRNRAE
jgi:hemoglobin